MEKKHTLKISLKSAIIIFLIVAILIALSIFVACNSDEYYEALINNEKARIEEEENKIYEFALDNEYKYRIVIIPCTVDAVTTSIYNIDLQCNKIEKYLYFTNYMPCDKRTEYKRLKNTTISPTTIFLTDDEAQELLELCNNALINYKKDESTTSWNTDRSFFSTMDTEIEMTDEFVNQFKNLYWKIMASRYE